MEDYSKLIIAAILAGICVLVLRRTVPEMSFAMSLLAAFAAAVFGFTMFGEISDFITRAAAVAGLPAEWLQPLYKTMGISVITRLSSDLMRDTQQLGLAAAIDFAGVLAALVAALPLLEAMLSLLNRLAAG